MWIAVSLTVLVALPFYWLVVRYNLHMYQLNGYKNNEYKIWLRKNSSRQRLLLLSGVLGIPLLFFPRLVLMLLVCLLWYVLCKYYVYLKKHNTKKKLVFTKRVQRLVVTDILLFIVLLVLGGILAETLTKLTGYGKSLSGSALLFDTFIKLPGLLALLIPLQPLLLPFAGFLNRPVEKAVNQYFIRDAKRKLAQVPGLTIIGITGSYGKTSVKFYLRTLLSERFQVLATPESYNTPMGVVRTIRESLTSSHEIFLCEMGARYEGDIQELCDIVHPKHGIITAIGPQHLETFGDLAHIVKTKFELADALPKEGMLFLNGDNPSILEKGSQYQHTVFYQSMSNQKSKDSCYQAGDIKLSQLGTSFTVTTPSGEQETFQTRLVGGHNVSNIMGAITVAHRLGISLHELKVPVRRIQPVPHRMQLLEHESVTIIDDAYNSNPVGSKAAVETLAMFSGLRILVTPGMVELGQKEEEFNYQFGTYAAKCCDHILLVGKDHVLPIQKGALAEGFDAGRCRRFDTLQEALNHAYGIPTEQHKYILLENDLPDQY